jgi:hypothetical protein
LLFENKLKLAKIPYFNIEMLIGNQRPLLANPTLCVHSNSNLFYKEALWNRLEKEIPSKYKKICFLDPNILFTIPKWVDNLSDLLNKYSLIQPYEEYILYNNNYINTSKYTTFLNDISTKIEYCSDYGWAITRVCFHQLGGFFDKSLLNKSNILMYNYICNTTISIYELIYYDFITYINTYNRKHISYSYLNTSINVLNSTTPYTNHTIYINNEPMSKNIKEWDTLFVLNSDRFWELKPSFNPMIVEIGFNSIDIVSNIHLQYSIPKCNDICVAFCYFNTCGYIRSLQNILLFENKLKIANIPYFSIEMVIGDQLPMLANPTLRVYSKSSLFYKEALWNRLEKEIPEYYNKIIFLDSDIIFQMPNWIDEISTMLDSYDIVHPFEYVQYLDLSYKSCKTIPSSVKIFKETEIKNKNTNIYASPGFGFAITRDFYRAINGFFDKSIIGNGDIIFFNCIYNKENISESILNSKILAYKEAIQSYNPKFSFLKTNIYHLAHGSKIDRQYNTRINIINAIEENYDTLFIVNSDGFLELIDDNLNNQLYLYFLNRNEDTTDYTTEIETELITEITKKPLSPIHIQYDIPIHNDICVA